MAIRYTDEFRRDAVRIATSSGLTRSKIASDLGVGLSTLNKGVQKHQHDDPMSGPHEDVEKENARLRKEVRVLRKEREVLKNGNLLCRPKSVRFVFIDAWKDVWQVEFLCRVMQGFCRKVFLSHNAIKQLDLKPHDWRRLQRVMRGLWESVSFGSCELLLFQPEWPLLNGRS